MVPCATTSWGVTPPRSTVRAQQLVGLTQINIRMRQQVQSAFAMNCHSHRRLPTRLSVLMVVLLPAKALKLKLARGMRVPDISLGWCDALICHAEPRLERVWLRILTNERASLANAVPTFPLSEACRTARWTAGSTVCSPVTYSNVGDRNDHYRRASTVAFRNRLARFWQAGLARVGRIGGYAAPC